jgi:LmbE family N-acetylglucosaminyl deacetylase
MRNASPCDRDIFESPMVSLQFARISTILCIGAHCDDIEIGCGGTLAHMVQSYPQVRIVWAVFSGDQARVAETRSAATELLGENVQVEFRLHEFRDSFFPGQYSDIKEAMGRLRREVEPDVVLTHFECDRHQDHRTLSELTWNAFRDHLVLEYEIPKYDGDLGRPNVYVALSEETARRKAGVLVRSFPSQARHDWFTADTFLALMRLRGVECRATSGFAEAYYGRKVAIEAALDDDSRG